MKPGDILETVTAHLGVRPCAGCRKSQDLLNSNNPADMVRGAALIPANILHVVLRGARAVLVRSENGSWGTYTAADGDSVSRGTVYCGQCPNAEARARADFAAHHHQRVSR